MTQIREEYFEKAENSAKQLADTGRFDFLADMNARELTAMYYCGPDLGVDYTTLVSLWREVTARNRTGGTK